MGPFCAPPSAFPLGRYIKCAVASPPPRFHTGGAKGIVVGEALRVQPKKTFFLLLPPRRQKMQGNKFPGDAFPPLSPFFLFVSHLRCSHCRRRPKERKRERERINPGHDIIFSRSVPEAIEHLEPFAEAPPFRNDLQLHHFGAKSCHHLFPCSKITNIQLDAASYSRLHGVSVLGYGVKQGCFCSISTNRRGASHFPSLLFAPSYCDGEHCYDAGIDQWSLKSKERAMYELYTQGSGALSHVKAPRFTNIAGNLFRTTVKCIESPHFRTSQKKKAPPPVFFASEPRGGRESR